MNLPFFLKVLALHFLAIRLVYASAGSWAFQQIETEKAWELARSRGSNVTVAIVDTGIDSGHKSTLWVNPGESGLDIKGRNKSTNGIDDDKNGYVDDVHGWNFVKNNNDLSDRHGHGSHIAGIISETAPRARLMILKYYDPKSTPEKNVRNTLKAFLYAIEMKASIINFSGGGAGENPAEFEILKMAEQQKILLVAAAGNDGMNTDVFKYYPANYPLKNILSVTATDQKGKLPYYGNFGKNSVHLAAPGDKIQSKLLFGEIGEMSGTSQATAFVSGVAALLLSENLLLQSPELLIERLSKTGNLSPALTGKTSSGRELNALKALVMKSPRESALGYVFENEADWNPEIYTVSSSGLDPKSRIRQSQSEVLDK